jgi:hypothetical protein
MKGYCFLVIGAWWGAVATVLSRTMFGIHFHRGAVNPATAAMIFRLGLPVLFYGWIVPTALGVWLVWAKK